MFTHAEGSRFNVDLAIPSGLDLDFTQQYLTTLFGELNEQDMAFPAGELWPA